jgi:hypothetical protein
MPTTEQISQLAALLAISEDGEPDELADVAIILWETIEQKLRQRKIQKKIRSMAEEYKQPSCPARLPVLRDNFFRLQIPHLKYRRDELESVAKAYVKSVIEENLRNAREATPEEISDYYANWKPIENEFDYSMAAFNFFLWWSSYHSNKVAEARRAAGKKSAGIRGDKTKKAKLKRAYAQWCKFKGLAKTDESWTQFKLECRKAKKGNAQKPEEKLLTAIFKQKKR